MKSLRGFTSVNNPEQPLVSVIMATYNNAKGLEASIESILCQTYQNIELLVLDDGSGDDTKDLLQNKFRQKKLRIFHNEENIGLTKCLNKLIELSNGKYIARQDDDDISLPKRIEIQVKKLENSNHKACTTRALVKDTNVKIPGLSFYMPTKLVMKIKNPHLHGTLLIEKDCLETVGKYDENFYYAQDYKLFTDLLKSNIPVLKINQPLYLLNTKNNISTKYLEEQNYYADCVRKNLIPHL